MTGQQLYELNSPDVKLNWHKKNGTIKWPAWAYLTVKEQAYWDGLAATYER